MGSRSARQIVSRWHGADRERREPGRGLGDKVVGGWDTGRLPVGVHNGYC